MGRFINKGNFDFTCSRNGEYIDKSGLISFINSTIDTQRRFTCVSRARRFGKSMALNMLYAYYDKSCDSHVLFDDLEIAKDASYEKHIGKYLTLHIDITSFITTAKERDIIDYMTGCVIKDLKNTFPEVTIEPDASLMDVLENIVFHTGDRFIFLIDEWDALCREFHDKPAMMEKYINLLRSLFKGGNTTRVFAAVYMTGILPIKQYGTQSALNNFMMYSMTTPGPLVPFFGFTDKEVSYLCGKYGMDSVQMRRWYNGYKLGSVDHLYNPTSVMTCIQMGEYTSYWTRTASFESVKEYINMDFDGVKESLMSMLVNETSRVSVGSFGNDSNVICSKDELFTLLIHYGYLTYDSGKRTVRIPNQEIREELLLAIRNGNRPELIKLIKESDKLLKATLAQDEEYVAEALDLQHSKKIAPQHYNSEEALRSLIHQAYISAIDDFIEIQELPTGKGYADVVFIPRLGSELPALVVELKYDKSADGAIAQIKNRRYPEVLENFSDDILLVGINYDKESKEHKCKIEHFAK